MKLRMMVMFEAAIVAAVQVVPGDVAPGRQSVDAQAVTEAVAMPGTELRAMTHGQACWLAGCVERVMREQTFGSAGSGQFAVALSALRRSGTAASRPVCRGGRTLGAVAGELGRLMREQRCGCSVPDRRVAACLEQLQRARASGVREEEVQRLARAAVARGDLAPARPDLKRQMEVLVREMVDGVGLAEVTGL